MFFYVMRNRIRNYLSIAVEFYEIVVRNFWLRADDVGPGNSYRTFLRFCG